MADLKDFNLKPVFNLPMLKRALIGAAIGLALISLFLSDTGEPDPEWGKYWMIRPLVVVPLAAGAGGAFFYYMTSISESGWSKVLATIFGFIAFLISLWLGTVLGLDGTYWN